MCTRVFIFFVVAFAHIICSVSSQQKYKDLDGEVIRKNGIILLRELTAEVKNFMDFKMNSVLVSAEILKFSSLSLSLSQFCFFFFFLSCRACLNVTYTSSSSIIICLFACDKLSHIQQKHTQTQQQRAHSKHGKRF